MPTFWKGALLLLLLVVPLANSVPNKVQVIESDYSGVWKDGKIHTTHRNCVGSYQSKTFQNADKSRCGCVARTEANQFNNIVYGCDNKGKEVTLANRDIVMCDAKFKEECDKKESHSQADINAYISSYHECVEKTRWPSCVTEIQISSNEDTETFVTLEMNESRKRGFKGTPQAVSRSERPAQEYSFKDMAYPSNIIQFCRIAEDICFSDRAGSCRNWSEQKCLESAGTLFTKNIKFEGHEQDPITVKGENPVNVIEYSHKPLPLPPAPEFCRAKSYGCVVACVDSQLSRHDECKGIASNWAKTDCEPNVSKYINEDAAKIENEMKKAQYMREVHGIDTTYEGGKCVIRLN